ncbi:Transposase IS4 [Popillia japonica]|uniref:Transposase IS4 n=1 Tax=Popillia japonica TaxID=7064 RepID=A0AAW1LTT4_POPJA
MPKRDVQHTYVGWKLDGMKTAKIVVHIRIDDMLTPFRGWCSFIQCIPTKPAKYGLKVFALCDPKTYVNNLAIYCGQYPEGSYRKSKTPHDITHRLVQPWEAILWLVVEMYFQRQKASGVVWDGMRASIASLPPKKTKKTGKRRLNEALNYFEPRGKIDYRRCNSGDDGLSNHPPCRKRGPLPFYYAHIFKKTVQPKLKALTTLSIAEQQQFERTTPLTASCAKAPAEVITERDRFWKERANGHYPSIKAFELYINAFSAARLKKKKNRKCVLSIPAFKSVDFFSIPPPYNGVNGKSKSFPFCAR